MNAERLHAVVLSLKKEITGKDVPALMETMVTSLRAVVQQSNAPNQQNFAASLAALYGALQNTESDRFSPGWRQILCEIGGEKFFGKELMETIETTLAKNQITPAVALQEFDKLLTELQKFVSALNHLTAAFDLFKIGDEKLGPGECEIGFVIPRVFVKNELCEFATELEELEFILNTFCEVATGKLEKLEIKTISSSDLMVYLQAHPLFAASLAVAIERIVSLYKQILEIRKLRQDLQKQGVPENVVEGVESHAKQVMESGIKEASVEIVKRFYEDKDGKGRKNELILSVQLAMEELAYRIDRGVNVEVRVAPLPAGDPKAQDEKIKNAIATIQAATPNIQFLSLQGQPILRLPAKTGRSRKKEKAERPEKPPKGE